MALTGKDYLIQTCTSKPAIHIALKNGLKRAGITDYYMFSTHNIRKTFEIWLMSLGIDGLKLTAHLGHSLQVAAGSYVSADIFSYEEKDQMRRIIGDLYAK
jgi:integrase